MSVLISIVLVISFGLISFLGLSVEDPATAEPITLPANNPLVIDTEPITRLALSEGVSDAAYVASADSLFVQQGANNWKRVGVSPAAGRIVFSAEDPSVLMVGDEAECFRGGGGAALQISLDGGATWTPAPGEGLLVRPLAIWADSNLAVGSSCEGLVVSNDLGRSWEILDDDLLGLNVTSFAVVEGGDKQILAALTGEGGTTRLFLFDLADPESWTESGSIAEYYGVAGLAGAEDMIFVASITGVSSSNDGGATWSTDRTGLEEVTLEFDPLIEGFPADFDPGGYGLTALYLDDDGPLLVGSNQDIYEYWNTDVRLSDAPEWEQLLTTDAKVLAFADVPPGNAVLVQTETEVWIVSPGSWSA